MHKDLREYAGEYGIALSDGQIGQFARYETLLLQWNERMNLTAITDEQGIRIKHFLDSLLVASVVQLPQAASLLDVGTGAGFPGVPLKILRQDLSLTLMDSLRKRVAFLEELSRELDQDNQCVHARAEELGRQPQWREVFSIVTARAVSALPSLCEYCLPFVRVGGVFVALKGPSIDAEVRDAENAMKQLGARLEDVKSLDLPDGSKRTFVLIQKISQTPAKFPRRGVRITKYPL